MENIKRIQMKLLKVKTTIPEKNFTLSLIGEMKSIVNPREN